MAKGYPTTPNEVSTTADELPAAFAAQQSKTFLGHPRGLFLLFFVEMWERFSYYGMRGLLILYLTAAIAAHQLKPDTYSNTLDIRQAVVPTQEETTANKAPPETLLRVPLFALVGKDQPQPADASITGEPGPLKFERLARKPDPANPGRFIWEPTGQLLSTGIVLTAEHGKEQKNAEPVRFRVTNPTDRDIKFTAKVDRPFTAEQIAANPALKSEQNPESKIYFTINDATGVLSTTIKPEAKRDQTEKPYELEFDLNRLDSGRSWIKANAQTLYGWYTGMAYLLPIIGGLIADKLIGTHRSMIVGGILIALGHIVLGLSGIGTMALDDMGMTIFVLGLALITIGTGHFKPSVSVMVGQLYPLGDPRRESAFSIFYMGINLGSFLCNIACGYLAAEYGWHYGFAAAAVGMILGLCGYMFFRSTYLPGIGEPINPGKGRFAPIFLPIGIALAFGVAGLYHVGVLGMIDEFCSKPVVVGLIAVAAIVYFIYFIVSQEPQDRGPVATIFIYMLFNAIFWLSFEQAGSSLNTFTEELTNRHIGGWEVPAPYFQSVNPLLIIIFAPIFGAVWAALARRKKSIAQPYKIGTGLIFVGLGYVVMVFAAMRLNVGIPKVGMIYITGCYFLHTVGEIILSPTGLSYVAKTAPRKSVSSLMGIWFISSFVAGLAAGKVGALVEPIVEGKQKLPWKLGGQADFFLLFVVTSCAAGVLILVIAPLLTRLQRNRQD